MTQTLKNTFTIMMAVLLCYQTIGLVFAQTSLDAQVSLGTMKVSDEVKVILIDGSEVTLKNETYPIYPDMIIDTLDNGKATLIVNGGKYVIEPNSIFKVQSIGDGFTGLLLTQGDQGEVCYCFNPKSGFLVDTPEADTIPPSESAIKAGSPQYVDGRTNVKDNITSAVQYDGYADFKTTLNTQTLEPGDAASSPEKQNPYDSFENKSGCCSPAAAPLLIPAAVGAAAVTGAVCGALCGNDDDPNASNVLRSAD
jgi:hypothetical protein